MRAVDIITKKRDGGELSREEIFFFVDGFTRSEIPDYQAAAWAMAIYFQGMTVKETADLTEAMAASGKKLDLSGVVSVAVDKHSTGGVGDKTTLVAQPTVAACGAPVGKMSGRGLSFTGGTLDKMESIRGYRIDLTTQQFLEQLKTVGLVLCGQTTDLAPADGKLYALRDVTGTVPPIPLIASSILSKKISAGAQAIVLDVKVGLGAFMPTVERAEELSRLMIEIGRRAGIRVMALISDMNQPLGHAVGNALEVREAIETMQGGGDPVLREHCLEVAARMMLLAGCSPDLKAAMRQAGEALERGTALEKFRDLVKAQGGDLRMVDEPDRLPQAKYVEVVESAEKGFLKEIHAREVGLTVVSLGGGREKKGDPIDYAVGVEVHHKVGDPVDKGQPLFTVHANDEAKKQFAIERLLQAHVIGPEMVEPLPSFYRILGD